ncbi:MAG: hypothetical protein JKY65_18905 [Planctomycetes bacterium]|nr:hypothetical protein [Planctomycetota bacterium]
MQTQPRGPKLRPACNSDRNRNEKVKRELRDFLRKTPLPDPVAQQVYRLVMRKDDYREHVEELIAQESVFISGHGYNAVLSIRQQLAVEAMESKLWNLAPMGLYASGHVWLVLSDLIQARGDYPGSVQASTVSKLLLSAATQSAAGTELDPYLTPVVGDQYELLHLGLRSSVERTVERRRKQVFDVHRCEDGSEAWFDVTALIAFHEELSKRRG